MDIPRVKSRFSENETSPGGSPLASPPRQENAPLGGSLLPPRPFSRRSSTDQVPESWQRESQMPSADMAQAMGMGAMIASASFGMLNAMGAHTQTGFTPKGLDSGLPSPGRQPVDNTVRTPLQRTSSWVRAPVNLSSGGGLHAALHAVHADGALRPRASVDTSEPSKPADFPGRPTLLRTFTPGSLNDRLQPSLSRGLPSHPALHAAAEHVVPFGHGHASASAFEQLSLGGHVAMGSPTELIAAIDQGTQSTRVYLFDKNQVAMASHQVSLEQIRPQPG